MRLIRILTILLILIDFIYPGNPAPDKRIHDKALKCISLTYQGDFRGAAVIAEEVIDTDRNSSAGYFLKAFVLDTKMEAEARNSDEREFYKACSKASEIGDNTDDVWERFFAAGANGAQGTYESRYENFVSGFKHGWKGVKSFKDIKKNNPWLKDVNYGIGTYYYFRSAMTEKMWWLPGVKDRKDEGISLLKVSAEQGEYTKDPSLLMLARIYNDYGKHKSALRYADRFLGKYPGNILAMWERCDALISQKRTEEAGKMIPRIQNRMFKSPFNKVRLYYMKLKLNRYEGNTSEAKGYLKRIKNETIPDVDKDRVKSIIKSAKELF